MTDFDFDLFVIGGGSGGVRAARMSANYGAKVGLAEEFRYGGTCVIRGCVPKKLLVYASTYSQAFADAAGFGWDVPPATHDWAKLRVAKDAEISRLEAIYKRNLAGAAATLFDQRATVASPHSVRLADGREISAKHILIATGGAPFVPPIEGAELAITSNEIFDVDALPERAMVVGGGYIASEFAGILNGLGVATTQVYRRNPILRGFDDEVRAHVQEAMRGRGIELLTNEDVARIEGSPGDLTVHLQSGAARKVGLILYATGRNPNTDGLGLDQIGVKLTKNGAVAVDDWSQSSIPSVYAVGDVTDRLPLTPVAIREGAAFADTVFGSRPTKADHTDVATAVFTQPEIGTVGLTEAQARGTGEIEVYRAVFRPMQNILAGRDEKMLMKLLVAKENRKVLGVHVVGPAAGEMIQLAGIAVKMGATKEDFDRTVAVHPTAAEELVTMKEPVG